MNKIAKFEKVSLNQYIADYKEDCLDIYNSITLPKRATTGSAGYDFYAPYPFVLKPDETIKVVTGIRCQIENGWVLQIFPRSSLGFKYKLQLDNTVGIIDSDYYYGNNEGHIMIKITNHSDKELVINAQDRFAQGIFLPFGITVDDDTDGVRIGGFGSTNTK